MRGKTRPRGPLEIAATADLPDAEPRFVEPMKAELIRSLPNGSDWIYEVKFDGIRAVAIKSRSNLRLLSRAGNDLTVKYAEIAEALQGLRSSRAVLDGEIVALDPFGRSSFQLLQSREVRGVARAPLRYYVFDLLNLDGKDLKGLPLWRRKQMAESLLKNLPPIIRFSPGIQADSAKVLREMQAQGLEGLIAKRRDSNYQPGRRSGSWAKFKWSLQQEFVIGGYTRPKGLRSYFGSLLVGYYQGKDLMFAARVGTGFDENQLASLYAQFQKLVRPDCPFASLPENLPNSGARGITAGEMRRCTWLEPKLVCQVRFAEWTRDHHLRQPAFLGLRSDKAPREVIRETPV